MRLKPIIKSLLETDSYKFKTEIVNIPGPLFTTYRNFIVSEP